MRLILIISILMIYSCNNAEVNQKNEKLPKGLAIIELSLDKKTTHSGNGYLYKAENNFYWVYKDRNQEEILFFDILNQTLAMRVPVFTEGPLSIGSSGWDGFWIKSLDSIVINPGWKKDLVFIDSTGRPFDKINYNTTTDGLMCEAFYSRAYNLPILLNNKLYLSQMQNDRRKFELQDYLNLKAAVAVDLNTKKTTSCSLGFPPIPKEYEKLPNAMTAFDRIYADNIFIYAPRYTHQIYSTDTLFQQWRSVNVKSKYTDNIEYKDIEDFVKQLRYDIETPHYLQILHDPYKNIYYRLVYPGLDEPLQTTNEAELIRQARNLSRLAVMVLDREFNIINEILLPDNTYLPQYAFVLPDGLYISCDNPLNPDFDENKFRFQRINIDTKI